MASHTVSKGDCMLSIARQYKFCDYKSIYDDSSNAELKKKRKNPNVLARDDVVSIPDKKPKEFSAATKKTHSFTVKKLEAKLIIMLEDDSGSGLGGKKCKLTVDGKKVFEGKTPGSGKLEADIEPDAKRGELLLWLSEETGIDGYRFRLDLGALEHESTVRGAQARLVNLGYNCTVTGTLDDATKDAVRGFQKSKGLTVNGNLDKATTDKLRIAHDGA